MADITITDSDIGGSFTLEATKSVVNTPAFIDPNKDITVNCLEAFYALAGGWVAGERDVFYHIQVSDLQFNGYVFPYVLSGYIGITAIQSITVYDMSLDGTFILTGYFPQSVILQYSLNGTFKLTGDFFSNRIDYSLYSSNWVAWSKIGDVRIQIDKTNDSGFKPMSWKGEVLQVKQLDKGAVIYGTDGITQMYPVTAPFPTFGFKDILTVGLLGKLAVAGDESVHYIISDEYELCKVSAKGIEVLGYAEFMSQLSPNTVMHWDARKRRLYISDTSIGFILTDQGLGGSFPSLTGLYRRGPTNRFLFNTEQTPTGFSFTTDIFTLGSRNLKTINKVSIETSFPNPMYCSIGYKIHAGDDWSWTAERQFNLEGIATVPVSGIEFMLKIRTESYDTCEIDDIIIRYKLTDKRHRFEYNPHALYAGGGQLYKKPEE